MACLLLPVATAGSAEAPELTDAAGDCAVPYGNEYLDIVAAWIDGETTDAFDVHLRLAKWTEPLAEGAALTVQFTHQGLEWGVIGAFGQPFGGGWAFATGQASAESVSGFEQAEGRFDAASATMTVTFLKSLFPHTDPNDVQLVGIKALTADLRTSYPYFIGGEAGVPLDGNGKWTVCDEGTATATYAFTGGHGGHTMAPADTEGAPTDATPTPEGTAEPDVVPAAAQSQNDTPLVPALLLAALAVAALARKR